MNQTDSVSSLNQYRQRIDEIDRAMIALFLNRLEVVDAIGVLKLENGIPIENPLREQEILDSIRESVDDERREAVCRLFTQIMKICKDRQKDAQMRRGEVK